MSVNFQITENKNTLVLNVL